MTINKISRTCSIENCNYKTFARQMCKPHYMQAWKQGLSPLERVIRKCSIEGCVNKHDGNDFCKKHNWRLYKYGDPLQLHPQTGQGEDYITRFWSRVDKTPGQGRDGDCWEWQAKSKDRYGYGGVQVKGKRWKAHQLAYYLTTGVEPTLHVLHSCDNPSCCNPDHLREGTPADNAQDKVNRQRTPRGEQAWNTILTADDVRYIREQCANGKMHKILAMEMNIPKSTISGIVTKRNWRYLE